MLSLEKALKLVLDKYSIKKEDVAKYRFLGREDDSFPNDNCTLFVVLKNGQKNLRRFFRGYVKMNNLLSSDDRKHLPNKTPEKRRAKKKKMQTNLKLAAVSKTIHDESYLELSSKAQGLCQAAITLAKFADIFELIEKQK